MKYYEVKFQIVLSSEVASDILSALLANEGFEAFESTSDGLLAWVQQSQFAAEGVDKVLEFFPLPDINITYSVSEAPDENWNQQWEQEGFRPIVIHDDEVSDGPAQICIHDTRHTDVPLANYDICINPCQAFGTGSHETTRMILRQLLDMPIRERQVVDAGTGTGILAILCRMLGASYVLAYDIDEWSVRNAQSNLLLNGIEEGVDVLLGDSRVLSAKEEDRNGSAISSVEDFSPSLLIANINRNILLADMPTFARCLGEGGELLLSGFYTHDVPVLLDEASKYGLVLKHQREDSNWALLLLKKEKS